MKRVLILITVFFLFAILTILIGIIPEVIGDYITDKCKIIFGEENYAFILSIAFVIGSFVLVYLTTNFKELIPTKKEKQPAKELINIEVSKIRNSLIASYQKRLDAKMATRQPINLQLKYSLEGTETKAPLYDNRTFNGKYIKEELISIFDKHRGRLLIIGEAGSGKTTLLIQLAISLLEREKEVIPIILNIATWRERFNSVEDWLNELLPQMGISKSLAQLLIKENRLLPLFDGLDELAEENRKACLEAIAEYGKVNSMQYVICSRIVEYAQTIDAPVYCQIQVRPLTLKQIKTQLKEVNSPESNGLLHAIMNDKLLAESVEVPFYFNTAQILFSSSKVLSEFNFKSSNLVDRKKEIVQLFAENSFKKVPHSIEDTNRWISFFAYEMNKHNLVVFELLSLQYSWSQWNKNSLSFSYFMKNLVEGLFEGLFYGLVVGLFSGLVIGLVKGLFNGLVIGLVYCLVLALFLGLFIGLFQGLSGGLIYHLCSKKVNRILVGLVLGLILGLFVTLFFSLFAGLLFGLFYGLYESLLFGLFFGLLMGLFVGLFTGLSVGLVEDLNSLVRRVANNDINTKENTLWSNSLLIRNIREKGYHGLILGLFVIFIYGLAGNFVYGLLVGLILGLVLPITLGFLGLLKDHNFSFIQLKAPCQRFISSAKKLYFSILQHKVLCYQLWRKGLLPLKLVDFLNELSKNDLMETDGATWRFRHRILQDYFANKWEEKDNSK